VALTASQHQQIPEFALFTLGMLAGGALASLERLRHRQRQHRRPGRRIALPRDEEGMLIERKLRASLEPRLPRWAAADDGDDEDERASLAALPASLADALRDLSEAVAAEGEALPPIVGIHLTATTLDVLLSAPARTPPPAPFTIAPARQAMCWTVDLDAVAGSRPVPLTPGEVGDLLPGLFTAGATEDGGGYLLLDLEAMRVTCCDGPDDLTDRLLVTAATELASSRWSGWYDLILVGCDELDILGRAELCGDLDDALDLLEVRARTVDARLGDGGPPDVRSRRLADPEDEDWGLALLVSRAQPTPDQMTRLLELADGPGGIAALVAGDTQADDGKVAPALFQLGPDPDRPDEIIATVSMAYLGPDHQITVWPQTLTVAEYEALAGVFATAADIADVDPGEAPYDDHAGPPWIRLAAAPVAPEDPGTPPDRRGGRLPEPTPASGPGQDSRRPADPWHGHQPVSWPDQRDDAEVRQARADGGAAWGANGAAPAGAHRAAEWPGNETAQWPGSKAAHVRDGDAAHRRHPGPAGLEIRVLGPVEIVGSAEPLQPKQAELVLALALHAPVGLSNSALCGLLGADADHPRPSDSVRQLITRTRRRLGHAPDGQEYIVHLGSGIYVLHPDARLDWTAFSALAARGRADARAADLHAALAMVRGQPFTDCYHWWIDIGLVETIRAEIVDAAELLANLELTGGDPRAAARAALAGLAAEAAAEQLWRALMCAEHDSGNLDGVTAAWNGCLDAIADIAPGADPHPDTDRLYRELTRVAVPAGMRY
jgi:DNA-binding SARP family transcriptional activator